MSEYILRAGNITKDYKGISVLDNFCMQIEKGSIYALIGPNGAGKTTFIRIVSGLSFKTAGEMELFHEKDDKGYSRARRQIGTLIEYPAFFMNCSAYENLEINRRMKQVEDKKRIIEVLDLVGLENTKKKVKYFSMGMKQRLGIAKALMAKPQFLILDEPTNGLDPLGMIKFRELILQLNQKEGITIFICSHILSELEQMASHYGIIRKGKMIKEFSNAEKEKLCGTYIWIQVNDADRAITLLSSKLNRKLDNKDLVKIDEYSFKVTESTVTSGDIYKILSSDNELVVNEIKNHTNSLELYVADIIGKEAV